MSEGNVREKPAGPAPVESARDEPKQAGYDSAVACLAKLIQDSSSTLELEQVMQNIASGVKCQVDYDTFAILLLDDLGQELYFRFAVGFPDEVVRTWRFGMGQGIVGTTARTQRTHRVDDVQAEPRYINAASRVRSELAIPLVVKNRTIGVLDVGSHRPHHFTEDHQQLLTFLAGHLANGIENARLYESVKQQAQTLSLLHETSRELTALLDREELLRKVAELVKRLIDYQLFSVLLWNDETQLLDHAFSLRYDERFKLKSGFPLGHGVTGTAAALRQSIRVPNVHLNPHYTTCGHGVEVRSELAVPLVFKDRLIGVLDLESVEYNAFSEQQEQMLSTLASYIAVALENTRLYEQVARDERRLEQDLRTAREIQKALLPNSTPGTKGLDVAFVYEPARELGGDFYDFRPYPDGRLAFAVGDAAGKGTPAALHASWTIGILRGHVDEHLAEPATMLAEMNRQLAQPPIENRFVAMVFGVFDPRDKSLSVANAGFTRPLLVRDGKVEELRIQGMPLGMLPGASYEGTRHQLQSGDVLVFSSDGVSESIDKSCEEFGARRLQARLIELAASPAAEIADELLRSTQRFSDPRERESDDRTIVVMKVR